MIENEKFKNLKELCIELKMPDMYDEKEPSGINLEDGEEEVAVRMECQELVTKLEKHWPGLDSEFLRTCLQLDFL